MESVGLEQYIKLLEPFANRELLTPQEASRILLLTTELLVDHCVDYQLLKFLSRFLTEKAYDDIIEERNIEHQCGYIICDKSPKSSVRRLSSNGNGTIQASLKEPGASTKYQIYNRKPSIILPNTYLSQYCCKEHYQASIFYRNQLSSEAVFARNDIMVVPPFSKDAPLSWYENGITCMEDVLQKHRELKDQGKSLSDVIAMMSGLSVNDYDSHKDTSQLIKLIQDFEIVERESNLTGNDADDENDNPNASKEELSSAVEGYITSNKSFGGYVV
ncbi:Rtr1/RPAP2 family-domain-containing protein [Scheffersomyces coipomensis]|uniref:Rtr1/RPAP2 family-domain-containing protein n=1 Tax=Scheffersomyces coipomensis TaxID=1788519 RepID=UPI00315C5E42